MKRLVQHFLIFLFLLTLFAILQREVFAESPTPSFTPTLTPEVSPSISITPTPSDTQSQDNSQQVQDLQDRIHGLEGKIADLRGQEKTLTSSIALIDTQIKLTELRINYVKQQISDLISEIQTAQTKISNLENAVNDLTKVLLSRIVATYEVGSSQPLQILASSNNISDYFQRANYLRIAQAHDKRLMYDTVQAKNDYKNQKDIYSQEKSKIEALKSQLEDYTLQQNAQKDAKQKLLAETQGSEANYQKLLAQAEAQLAGFQSFVHAHWREVITCTVKA